MDLERHTVGVRDGDALVALALLHGERQAFVCVLSSHRGREGFLKTLVDAEVPVVACGVPLGFERRIGYVAADGALDRLQIAHSDEEIREALADVMHAMRNDPPAAFLTVQRAALLFEKLPPIKEVVAERPEIWR